MIYRSLSVLLISVIAAVVYMTNETKFSAICQKSNDLVASFLEIKDNEDKVLIDTQLRVKESIEVLEQALEKYQWEELAISYNGGKDCLVMLILYLSVLSNHYSNEQLDHFNTLKSVYINYEKQFPELLSFIDKSTKTYSLDLTSITMNLKEGFTNYLSNHDQIKAIIVGTRRADPYASDLKHFQATDHGWPSFMRIHPVINWHFDEIWCFLKKTNVEYCKLYDMGFTSLGGIDSTIRNPNLKLSNGEYLPAYKLLGNDSQERDGRNIETIKKETR